MKRKSPVALGADSRRQNRFVLKEERGIRRGEVLLSDEGEESREQPEREALGLHELRKSSIQGQSFRRGKEKGKGGEILQRRYFTDTRVDFDTFWKVMNLIVGPFPGPYIEYFIRT